MSTSASNIYKANVSLPEDPVAHKGLTFQQRDEKGLLNIQILQHRGKYFLKNLNCKSLCQDSCMLISMLIFALTVAHVFICFLFYFYLIPALDSPWANRFTGSIAS